ncbi:MAG: hypothetical protein LAO78_16110 [Acidobacteriia bacterium]|nr:hypothetical protein [Terriglobia bacterium]
MNIQGESHGQAATQARIEPGSALESATPPVPWSFGTRIGFRLAFIYFILYSFPFPVDLIPYTDFLDVNWDRLWRALVPWVAEHVLHLSYKITVFTNGSGDTTYDYVKTLCYAVLAITAAVVWSVLDRKRSNYQKLHGWLRLCVRIVLAAALLSYGAVKVIPNQMPDPPLSRLLTTNGDSTPMSLLWTFLGASRSYEIFAGLMEMVGGILLFFPRVSMLGALVSAATMTNVFMMNMSYDVPVKLYSFHLLLMSVWLLLPDLQRLANFFVFNREVKPQVHSPFFQRRWLNVSFFAAQLLLGLYLTSTDLYSSYQRARTSGFLAPTAPLYGIWMVDEFTIGGQPPQLNDQSRWQQAIFDNSFEVVFQSVGGKRQRFIHQTDVQKKTVTVWRRENPGQRMQIAFDRPQPDAMTLDGNVDGKQIHAKLHRVPVPKFLLNTRGFHWINEYPFNRYNE